jgi:hypothetical protein
MFKGRALVRILLAAFIAALLLGDVFRGLHLLHARHVLCPEHGELVDAEEAISWENAGPGRAEALPGGDASHHHEHCGLAAAPSRSAGLFVASAAPCIHGSPSVVAPVPARATPVLGRSVLTYAPKQSPPVFAA